MAINELFLLLDMVDADLWFVYIKPISTNCKYGYMLWFKGDLPMINQNNQEINLLCWVSTTSAAIWGTYVGDKYCIYIYVYLYIYKNIYIDIYLCICIYICIYPCIRFM